MRLDEILCGYKYEVLGGDLDKEISNIENDSRLVGENGLFIAEVGYTVDGHDFIDKAIENGATAVLVERELFLNKEMTVIKVDSTLDAMAYVSGQFHSKPWERLNTIGITGTNGKTSTTYYIKNILEKNKKKIGIIGTIGSIIDNEKIEVQNTTPNSLVMNKLLDKMVGKNVDYSIMEVSSHALALKRVEYMEFETGIFMNLSKDHLDYHKTIDNYFESKYKLFNMTNKSNIINIDDEYGQKIIERNPNNTKIITYGINNRADVYATEIKYGLDKVEYKLNIYDEYVNIILRVPGEFSVYNSLAAAACAYSYGIDIGVIKEGLESIEGVKGRFEVITTNEDYSVIIDFAHTADGLKQVLKTIGGFVQGRKIVVFGAGGNRDKTKRPEMGAVVGDMADIAIVTSDNPRFEIPEEIIKDVVRGVEQGKAECVAITDRKKAIEYALDIGKAGDIILLAGKGHETYTLINGETIPFDERKIVLEYLGE